MSKIHVWLGETLCTPDEFSYDVKLSTDYETFKTCPTPYLGGT